MLECAEPAQTVVAIIVLLLVAILIRKVLLTRRVRAAEELAHPGYEDESVDELALEL